MIFRVSAIFFLLLTLALARTAPAETFLSKSEALALAFPQADRVETLTIYLTPEESALVEKLSGARLDSPIYTFYQGQKGGATTGFAAIEAANVRTLPATIMVVLTPDGAVRFAEVLAFFEPREYLPSTRWLDQFKERTLDNSLRVGGEIQGISGATLSAQALTRQVRKSAALLQVLLKRG